MNLAHYLQEIPIFIYICDNNITHKSTWPTIWPYLKVRLVFGVLSRNSLVPTITMPCPPTMQLPNNFQAQFKCSFEKTINMWPKSREGGGGGGGGGKYNEQCSFEHVINYQTLTQERQAIQGDDFLYNSWFFLVFQPLSVFDKIPPPQSHIMSFNWLVRHTNCFKKYTPSQFGNITKELKRIITTPPPLILGID